MREAKAMGCCPSPGLWGGVLRAEASPVPPPGAERTPHSPCCCRGSQVEPLLLMSPSATHPGVSLTLSHLAAGVIQTLVPRSLRPWLPCPCRPVAVAGVQRAVRTGPPRPTSRIPDLVLRTPLSASHLAAYTNPNRLPPPSLAVLFTGIRPLK